MLYIKHLQVYDANTNQTFYTTQRLWIYNTTNIICFMLQKFYVKGIQHKTWNWDGAINLICFFYYCCCYHYFDMFVVIAIYVFTMVAFVFILNKKFRGERVFCSYKISNHWSMKPYWWGKQYLKSCLFTNTSYPPRCALKAIFISCALRIYFAIRHI